MAGQGKLSQAGFNFLKKEEGYKNVAYTLKGETYPTVGFGHHSPDLIDGKYYSDAECMAFFEKDSARFCADVNRIWNPQEGMTQSMFDAMFSFAYNHGNISSTQLGKTIMNGGWKNRSKVCSVWLSSYCSGKYATVLSRRRKNESSFFYQSDSQESGMFAPSVSNLNATATNETSSVLSSSSSNTYNSLGTPQEQTSETKITRIYKSIDPTIQLDELSLPLDGYMDAVDPETGEHVSNNDAKKEMDDAFEGSGFGASKETTGIQNNQNDVHTKTNRASAIATLGIAYPIIRINDHYFGASEIDYFMIETKGFLPIMQLRLVTQNNDLQKTNTIKEGDKCSVFISSGHGMIKSLRCDFLITCFEAPTQSQLKVNEHVTYNIYGELFVPNLYNENMTFSFAGTSKEALEDVAQRLGLGFFFSDVENTNDTQMWYCMPDGDDRQGTSMVRNYISDVASHAWKGFDSFYDCWIDPRYGLSFININQMLGIEGLDETFDVTMFSSSFSNTTIATEKEATANEDETRKDPRMQVKMISNIGRDDESNTPFFAMAFNEVNQTNEITKKIGIYSQSSYTIDNQGVQTDNNTYDMNYSIPYNQTKLDNGFYILVGPGRNISYNQADNGTYTEQNTVKRGGKTTDIQADSDASSIKANKSNKLSTGNVNKFYDAAYEHNRLNNLFIQKKYIEVTLRGMNLSIMRGEKIPTMFVDNNKMNMLLNSTDKSKTENQRITQYMNDCVFTNLSGWFVIDAITWEYSGNKTGMTPWTTNVKLVRREWPRPGYTELVTTTDNQMLQNTVTVDNTASVSNVKEKLTTAQKDTNDNGELPLDGLQDYMKELWLMIKQQAGSGNVKLVGARRYAVDEEGNRDDGNAYVKTAQGYKCMDARGNILYFNSNNSTHLYGEAIDIINSGTLGFDDLLNKVIGVNGDILKKMLDNGVSLYIETSKDDNGTKSKHYHIGTDTIKQKAFWETVVKNLNNGNMIKTSHGSFNLMSYVAYSRTTNEYQNRDTITI